MIFETRINGLPVRAEYSDEACDAIFLPLLKRLVDLRRAKGLRLLVLLAAPPGAGKSTLAAFLCRLAALNGLPYRVEAAGMDGFHYPNAYLAAHTTVRDGVRVPLKSVKGAPETFDLPALTRCVRALAAGERVCLPVYDRRLHDPVPGTEPIGDGIIVMEGNYLLLDMPGWDALKGSADYTVRVIADESDLRGRLIDRKAAGGMPREEAARFVERSDMANVRLVSERTAEAELELRLTNGEYEKIDRKMNETLK